MFKRCRKEKVMVMRVKVVWQRVHRKESQSHGVWSIWGRWLPDFWALSPSSQSNYSTQSFFFQYLLLLSFIHFYQYFSNTHHLSNVNNIFMSEKKLFYYLFHYSLSICEKKYISFYTKNVIIHKYLLKISI